MSPSAQSLAVLGHGRIICRKHMDVVVDILLRRLDKRAKQGLANQVRDIKRSENDGYAILFCQLNYLVTIGWHGIEHDGIELFVLEQAV